MQKNYRLANCVAYLLVPVAVGSLTGWLVGSSQSPVVGTVIPLIFGLLTAIGFGAVGAILRKSAILDAVRAADLSDDITEKLESEIRAGISPSTTLFAAFGVIVFCISFYVGVDHGIARRVPKYPPLAEMFPNISLEPEESAILYNLRMSLAGRNVSTDEYVMTMSDVIRPILTDDYGGATPEDRQVQRIARLRDTVEFYLLGDGELYLDAPAEPGPPAPVPIPTPEA